MSIDDANGDFVYFLFERKRIFFPILILVLANCLTWPMLNILHQTTSIHLLILESGVNLVEAIVIYCFLAQKFSKALLISFVQDNIV